MFSSRRPRLRGALSALAATLALAAFATPAVAEVPTDPRDPGGGGGGGGGGGTSTPVMTGTVPSISGTPRVGQTLFAYNTFTPTPDRVQYDWLVDGTFSLATATNQFKVRPEDLGKRISVSVAAFKEGYPTAFSGLSPETAVVQGPVEMRVTASPGVSGTFRVGETLRVTSAPRTDPVFETVTYQWFRSINPIPGATGTSYTLGPSDAAQPVWVQATLKRTDYATAYSGSQGSYVGLGEIVATSEPLITGTPRVGSRLAAAPPTTDHRDYAYFRWTRDGVVIAGATGATYTPVAADVGHRIGVDVRVTAAGYADHHASARPVTVEPALRKPRLRATATTASRTARKARLVVLASAPAAPPLAAKVTVRRGGKLLRAAKLSKGRLVTTVKAKRGQKLRITIAATSRTKARTITVRVR
ncbi:hypothetical protein [Nocardioides sp. J54]|uniref:hypothetical protein n=1 Tax=Nocardioides sp. J54 TaxID=935866 RepID=UPI00048F1923|nr:hypothetical protein [Nocardioides sp. J54]